MNNSSRVFAFLIPVTVIVALLLLTTCSSVHVVEPGTRGVPAPLFG